MGKSQTKKKTQGWRHNPIRVPDSYLGHGKAAGQGGSGGGGKEGQLLPILNKLKSVEYADRTWACAAICNLIQNDAATRRLFQGRNVVGELIERLSDDVDEVVVEASGALRNLGIDGGHELCGEMYNKGIMPHLVVLMGKISNTIDSILSSDPSVPQDLTDAQLQARKHLLSLSENVIALVWCLAETSHKTLAAVNTAGVEGLLVKVLQGREVCGLGVALAAAQALYSLSQDNPPFRHALFNHPTALPSLVAIAREDHTAAEDSLVRKTKPTKGKEKSSDANGHADELGDGRALLVRVLVCGVLRNVVLPGSRSDEVVEIRSLTNEVVLPLINSLLDVDPQAIVSRVAQLVAELPEQDGSRQLDKGFSTDHRSSAEVSLERVERMLSTVVVGLEILTGICAGLEDVEETEEGEDAEAAEVKEEMDEDMDAHADADADSLEDEALIEMGRDPAEVIDVDGDLSAPANITNTATATLPHLLSTLSLPSRLLKLSLPTAQSFPPTSATPSLHPPTTAVLSSLHLRALEALNNLLLTLAASVASDPTATIQAAASIPAQQLWDGLYEIVLAIASEPDALGARGQEMRGEVMDMALGCLWGVAKVAAAAQLGVAPQQIQGLMDVTALVRSEGARTRTIDTLATLASRPTVTLDENKAIGDFLMTALTSPPPSTSTSNETLIALINAIIDIYADETRPTDSVFVQSNYLSALASTVGKVRGLVKGIDKRKDRVLRGRGEEVYENLVAFIRYRRGLSR